jgi:tRNA nucleotidyltransferase/poly(A) polymerase
MMDLTPRQPKRPLLWADVVLDLQDMLADTAEPIYIVGGAVRDAYLHRPIKDLDIVTPHDALSLARKIANRLRGNFFALDTERGVGRALLMIDGAKLTIDVSQFRGANLLEDLTDRDFTANAIAVDLHGDLSLFIDPLDGETDLLQKRLRRCNPRSIADDSIRALRAIRQSVQLGLRIEAETLKDIRIHAASLVNISPERVRDEVFNLLALPKAAAALRVVDASGMVDYLIPNYKGLTQIRESNPDTWSLKLTTIERLVELLSVLSPNRSDNITASFALGIVAIQLDHYRSRLVEHTHTSWANERSHRALLVLAVLLDELNDIETVCESLRLSNPERQRILKITNRSLPTDELLPLVIHRFWRKTGEAGIDICLLALAQYLARAGTQLNQDNWLKMSERVRELLEAYYERYEQLVEPPVLLNGDQLMKILNLKPGPIIGKLLDAIREAQVVGEIQSPEDALEFARTYLA